MTGYTYHLTSQCGKIDEMFNSYEDAHRWLAKEYPSYIIFEKSNGVEKEKAVGKILPSVCRITKITDS